MFWKTFKNNVHSEKWVGVMTFNISVAAAAVIVVVTAAVTTCMGVTVCVCV